jgi:hypothetical protein
MRSPAFNPASQDNPSTSIASIALRCSLEAYKPIRMFMAFSFRHGIRWTQNDRRCALQKGKRNGCRSPAHDRLHPSIILGLRRSNTEREY